MKTNSGGPGSQKGSVVEELVSEYNFEGINVENTLFENIASLAGSTDYDNLVTIDWLLSMISEQIVNSSKKFFVIDIVPTISAIQRCASFRERNHDDDMEKFEKRVIIMALDLNLIDEKILLGRANTKEKKNEKELSPELSAFMKGVDEADKGRLEKRYEAYCKCSIPFLTYFQSSKRILRFDITTTTRSRRIIRTLNGVLHNLGLSKNNPAVRAILFAQSMYYFLLCETILNLFISKFAILTQFNLLACFAYKLWCCFR
uniref:Adenylate kinase n=1 Tax=Syphacia muris TaxID=451379 RepID=A0A0N5AJE9_9BILA